MLPHDPRPHVRKRARSSGFPNNSMASRAMRPRGAATGSRTASTTVSVCGSSAKCDELRLAAAVALAFYNVAIAESVERGDYEPIDMCVGDY
jgi:hypothetical protein